MNNQELLTPSDQFVHRHIGPRDADIPGMLDVIGLESLDQLIEQSIPNGIRMKGDLELPSVCSETQALRDLRELANKNQVFRSLIGLGYYDTITPPVIQRNVLENPGWYTQYTPYQAEISQGRLEALVNFQTMVTDLTGLDIANASMLDEATAAAEAMTMLFSSRPRRSEARVFFVSELCFPQTIAVLKTRAGPLGIEIVVGDHETYDFSNDTFGVLVQYPTSIGEILDYETFFEKSHGFGAKTVVAADILALVLLRPPGEFGADIAVGSTQRFGVPMGFGGPHAAYMATKDELKRHMPGRLVGVSVDRTGKPALRLALQTREQHIRRDRATSNICTAQVLLAVMASFYAVYHGPEGLTRIAKRINLFTIILRNRLIELGYVFSEKPVFDTLTILSGPMSTDAILEASLSARFNFYTHPDGKISISLDERTTVQEVCDLLGIFGDAMDRRQLEVLATEISIEYPEPHVRESKFMTHLVFNSYRSETEMLRYIHRLQNRDLSLTHSMIPLGSCTMKLNGTTEMYPVTWPEFGHLHPFAPAEQTKGYRELFSRLERLLSEITGFASTSLQPNAGSQGEYTGLLTIRAYHHGHKEDHRNICLIPSSAHGTNPASAVMAGMQVIVVETDDHGNVMIEDLEHKAELHKENLAALMITYPSTHGVYESSIKKICQIVHANGGLVYMDGANMNALVGFSQPGDWGADVCHLNLHKTFCIPHGGGGPGMGPICVTEDLAPFLPGHPIVEGVGGIRGIGPVSAAPWGSPSILPISYAYIQMMGLEGLKKATEVAILNANYLAERLEPHFPVLYRGENRRVAHECILELRHLKDLVSAEDVAKRLMDYGFHAPTLSFPVPGTLMIEPTESESLEELDRFTEAMIAIRREIQEIEDGIYPLDNNPVHNAPHTAEMITDPDWSFPYSRRTAAYPLAWIKDSKFWPFVGRIDNVYGDRNLFCMCVPVEEYALEPA